MKSNRILSASERFSLLKLCTSIILLSYMILVKWLLLYQTMPSYDFNHLSKWKILVPLPVSVLTFWMLYEVCLVLSTE